VHCKHVPEIVSAALERLHNRIGQLEAELEAERTAAARARAQLEPFKADNIKLQGEVKKLQEALAASSLTFDPINRMFRDATINELTRKLADRDRSLDASRARAMSLQKRINAAAALVDTLRPALGEVIIY
jgi:chromosome segregation ATPase